MNIVRPAAARWFEVLVEHDGLARVVEALAGTGLVQLEACDEHPALALAGNEGITEQHRELLDRFADWRPPPEFRPLAEHRDLRADLEAAAARLATWAAEIEPLVRRIEKLAQACSTLDALREFVSAADALDFTDIDNADSGVACALFLTEPGSTLPELDTGIVHHAFETSKSGYVLILAPRAALAAAERSLGIAGARRLDWPAWLHGPQPTAAAACDQRRMELEAEEQAVRDAIRQAGERAEVAQAAGDLLRIGWLTERLGHVTRSTWLGSVTGWTRDFDGTVISAALGATGIPCVVHFPKPPTDRIPPTIVRNPAWLRPFELFARLIGTPGTTEPDPARLLAVLAPLLFGFMFGDVGQGAVLLAVGLLLRRQLPVLGLLVPGGLMAMIFGVLYGSVFTVETLIPALWVRPMEAPLVVLGVSLAGGAAIILLGLCLGALAALWSGTRRRWLLSDAGLLVAYVGAMGFIVAPGLPMAVLVSAGLAWFVAGSVVLSGHAPVSAVFGALGSLAEHGLQLAVNTLSFVRVGAFALAHAGLGLAVHGLATASANLAVSIIVGILGNLLILALEGLVVSVQTTRLILFEFFVRFFEGLGRPFQPTTMPHA